MKPSQVSHLQRLQNNSRHVGDNRVYPRETAFLIFPDAECLSQGLPQCDCWGVDGYRGRTDWVPGVLPSRKCQCLCLLSPVKDHHFQSHLKQNRGYRPSHPMNPEHYQICLWGIPKNIEVLFILQYLKKMIPLQTWDPWIPSRPRVKPLRHFLSALRLYNKCDQILRDLQYQVIKIYFKNYLLLAYQDTTVILGYLFTSFCILSYKQSISKSQTSLFCSQIKEFGYFLTACFKRAWPRKVNPSAQPF